MDRFRMQATRYRKGDVVLVTFPVTTEQGELETKRRPAVIVSNDHNNVRLDDVLVVPLTSNSSRHNGIDSNVVIVRMNSAEGQAAGLRLDSVVDCTVIATIPKTLLVNKIGRFPDETIMRIDRCLRRNIDPTDDGSLGAGVPRKPLPFDGAGEIALELPLPTADSDDAQR